jgi:hypothetical protein
MRKWVLSGILASEETYLSHLEALLLVRPQPVYLFLLFILLRPSVALYGHHTWVPAGWLLLVDSFVELPN